MVLVRHKFGGVQLPKYKIKFKDDQPVEVPADIAEKILRNPDFEKVEENTKKKVKD